jgi:hypothetical protein
MEGIMQNTTTKTARNIVRNILKQNNVMYSPQSYTNKCANPKLRNLCFLTKNLTPSVVQQIQAALPNVAKVHATKPMFYNVHPDARYLRIVHCAK